MTPNQIRKAIFLSIGAASVSMACAEKEESTDSNTTTDSAAVDINLPTIPAGDYPECTEASSEFFGPCCVEVYCVDPTNGECVAAEEANPQEITGVSLGSGNCLCDPVDGPYSSEGAEAYTDTTGACCYLVGIQGCEGRPMLVDNQHIKAPLIRGQRWRA